MKPNPTIDSLEWCKATLKTIDDDLIPEGIIPHHLDDQVAILRRIKSGLLEFKASIEQRMTKKELLNYGNQ